MNKFVGILNLFKQAFFWWKETLSALLPGWFSALDKKIEIFITPQNKKYKVEIVSLKSGQYLKSFNALELSELKKIIYRQKEKKINLLLPEEQFLEARITVPAKLNSDLRAIILYKIPSLTPFKKEDVFFDFKRENYKSSKVEICLVQKTNIEETLDELLSHKIVPEKIVSQENSEKNSIRLIPHYMKSNRWKANYVFVLHRLAIFSLIVFLASYFYLQERKTANYEELIQGLLAKRNTASKFQKQIDKLNQNVSEAFKLYSDQPSFSYVFIEVMKARPEETYFSSIELEKNSLILKGSTGNASKFLENLDTSYLFQSPRFIGSIRVAEQSSLEEFVIKVNLKGGNDAKSK